MPLLVIVRHAKAELPQPGVSDFDRALTVAGRRAATHLGRRLADAEIVPSRALVSTANRAQQTWKLMSAAFGHVHVDDHDELYGAEIDTYIELLASMDDEPVVTTVAHEPTASAVSRWLAQDRTGDDAASLLARGLETSGAAVLEFGGLWADLEPGCARLVGVFSGKD